MQRRNIEGISPTADSGPVGVDIGLLALEQALVHSGLDIDLLTYEQVLVQDGQERGHHFWIRPMRLQAHVSFYCVSIGITGSHFLARNSI